jgi:hypothetical protein
VEDAFIAAETGDIKLMRQTIKSSPETLFVSNGAGDTAAHIAAYQNHVYILKMLASSEPGSLLVKNAASKTAIELCSELSIAEIRSANGALFKNDGRFLPMTRAQQEALEEARWQAYQRKEEARKKEEFIKGCEDQIRRIRNAHALGWPLSFHEKMIAGLIDRERIFDQ